MSRPSLWFGVPAHGRLEISAICFRAIAWACEELADLGIDATACVVAVDGNLNLAREHGFATIERGNEYLGLRVNDFFEFAAEQGVDFAATFGSDTWADPQLIGDLPAADEIACARWSAAVSENGERIVTLNIPYPGGDGVRVFPMELLRRVGYRPAADYRKKAIDGSIRDTLEKRLGGPLPFRYRDLHPLQIVDFKSRGQQLTSYSALRQSFATGETGDPFERLADVYPAGLVEEMRGLYAARLAA